MSQQVQKQKTKYEVLKANIDQSTIENSVAKLSYIIDKINTKGEVEIILGDYLHFLYCISQIEKKGLSIREIDDFSRKLVLKWHLHDKNDLDYMILRVLWIRFSSKKSLKDLPSDSNPYLSDENWEKFLFIDNLIDLDKYKFIEEDYIKLHKIFLDNVGNLILSGVQFVTSKNIDALWNFLQGGIRHVSNNTYDFSQIDSKISQLTFDVLKVKEKIEELFHQQTPSKDTSLIEEKISQIEGKIEMLREKIDSLNTEETNVPMYNDNIEKIQDLESRLTVAENMLENFKEEMLSSLKLLKLELLNEIENRSFKDENVSSKETEQQRITSTIPDEEDDEKFLLEEENEKNENVTQEQTQEVTGGKKKVSFISFGSLKWLIILWIIIFLIFLFAVIIWK